MTQSLNQKALESAWHDHCHTPRNARDFRWTLIDAVSEHEGWEESAVALVDEVIMPIIRQHAAANNQSESSKSANNISQSFDTLNRETLIERMYAEAWKVFIAHGDIPFNEAIKLGLQAAVSLREASRSEMLDNKALVRLLATHFAKRENGKHYKGYESSHRIKAEEVLILLNPYLRDPKRESGEVTLEMIEKVMRTPTEHPIMQAWLNKPLCEHGTTMKHLIEDGSSNG